MAHGVYRFVIENGHIPSKDVWNDPSMSKRDWIKPTILFREKGKTTTALLYHACITGIIWIWRIPPSFDGAKRSPLPRFTTLTNADREKIVEFFGRFGEQALRVLVPGANIVVATNPLVSHLVAGALESAGLEPRGQLVRLVQTMRGGRSSKGI